MCCDYGFIQVVGRRLDAPAHDDVGNAGGGALQVEVLGAAGLVRHEGGDQAYEAPHGLTRALHLRGGIEGGAVGGAGGRGGGGRRAGAQGLCYQAYDEPKGGEAAGAAHEAEVERDTRGSSESEERCGGDCVPHEGQRLLRGASMVGLQLE